MKLDVSFIRQMSFNMKLKIGGKSDILKFIFLFLTNNYYFCIVYLCYTAS